MLEIKEYVTPSSLEEAYKLLISNRNNYILGGCAFLKCCNMKINKGIDLKNLDLNYIKEDEKYIYIGGDTSLRDIEISTISYLKELGNGISNILGVPFRRTARIGGSVFSKYGFSDIIPILIVLEAEINLYKHGVLAIDDFLLLNPMKDILIEIRIPKKNKIYFYENIRKSSTDFPILCAGMSRDENNLILSVGARPGVAMGFKNLKEDILNNRSLVDEILGEIKFSSNIRATKEYRKEMCKVLIERLIKKVGINYDWK